MIIRSAEDLGIKMPLPGTVKYPPVGPKRIRSNSEKKRLLLRREAWVCKQCGAFHLSEDVSPTGRITVDNKPVCCIAQLARDLKHALLQEGVIELEDTP